MDGPGNFATLDGATTMTRVQFLWRLVLAFLVGTAFTVVCVAYLSVSQGDGKAVGRVVQLETAEGRSLRALVLSPPPSAAPSKGALILLAGGHGNLALQLDGTIRWGSNNQLVRTRTHYARLGYTTIVPDIPDAFKVGEGARHDYRWSSAHLADLAAIIAYAHRLAGPVHLIGTSRSALSVMAYGAASEIHPRPNSLIVTSGMLVHVTPDHPSAERTLTHLDRIAEPTLLLYHANDECHVTPPGGSQRFRAFLPGASKLDIVRVDGPRIVGNAPCQADSAHGFLGLDAQVVQIITAWLDRLPDRGTIKTESAP